MPQVECSSEHVLQMCKCEPGALLQLQKYACLSSPTEFQVKMQAPVTVCLRQLITNYNQSLSLLDYQQESNPGQG